ncbi:MAG: hypothetical protein EA426_07460 [Spirochaetaceae bacterium]|nr:MAG: hypothetical protein EA426_07460 [Spirochaetaceae bacterium]
MRNRLGSPFYRAIFRLTATRLTVAVIALLTVAVSCSAPVSSTGVVSYPGAKALNVNAGTFSVVVRGSDNAGIVIVPEAVPDGFTIVHEMVDDTVHVRVEKPIGFLRTPTNARIVFLVPRGTLITTSGTVGAVTVTGISSEHIAVQTSTGAVRVTESSGTLAVTATDATVDIEDVRGAIEVRTGNANVEFTGFRGSAAVTTSGGSITASRVAITGDSTFRSGTGDIDLALENGFDSIRFVLNSSRGVLRVGGNTASRSLTYGTGPITIEGHSSGGNVFFRRETDVQ